ncbi:hypothetical protein [Pseudomonas sp. B392_1p]|uniref:hypothetical protein n=1 Tax=Pseudomonas sp. B392_1p TaxID=3457507 RepID=UPI003FCFC54E
MEKQNIQADKITKPIQLLGAWLVGLLATDAAFLFTASSMGAESWQSGALTIAAIINVPVFIAALFVLQTKFRPELQEDSYYATYLNNRTNQIVKIPKKELRFEILEDRIKQLEESAREQPIQSRNSLLTDLSFGINVHLANNAKIQETLFNAGIRVAREFGYGADAPDQIKVAVVAGLPEHIKNEVFKLATSLGIDYYAFIEPWEEIDEDVLFGAYGETEGRIMHKSA